MSKINEREALDEALANIFAAASKYSQDYQFYGHMLAQCNIELDKSLKAPADVNFDIDHYNLFINPELFGQLTLPQRLAELKHQMLHILSGHVARLEERDEQKWQVATDCAINQFINKDHLVDDAVLPENFPTQNSKLKIKDSSEYYYSQIDDSQMPPPPQQCENPQGGSGEGEGEGDSEGDGEGEGNGQPQNGEGKGNHQHDKWKESRGDGDMQKDITKNMIEKSVSSTEKSRGNIPGQLSDWMQINSVEREVDWRRVLRNIVGNKRVNSRKTIMRPDRRMPEFEWIKGKTKDKQFELAVVGDESGSVSNKELVEALGEIIHITKMMQSDLWYCPVDTQAYEPFKIAKNQRSFERSACGGTELKPAIDMLNKKKIDYNALVVITDGGICQSDVDAFAATGKRVIWLITSNGYIMDSMNEGKMSAFQLKGQ